MKNLKIFNTGIIALIFGLAIIFTQSAFKPATGKNPSGLRAELLYYHGPDYSQIEVTRASNWTGESTSEFCDDVDNAACTITVDPEFVDYSGTYPELKSDANLTAAPHGTVNPTYYITGADDPTISFVNKTE